MALDPDDQPPGAPVGALFAPWAGRDQALAAAAAAAPDLTVLRWGILPSVVVVRAPEPDLIDRLHRAGAWVVYAAGDWAGCTAAHAR